jgi:hypothetical protein
MVNKLVIFLLLSLHLFSGSTTYVVAADKSSVIDNLPRAYSGTFKWHERKSAQIVLIVISKVFSDLENNVVAEGSGKYYTNSGNANIDIKILIIPETLRFEMWEKNAESSSNFATDGSHVGKISSDLKTIQAVWTTKSTGVQGDLNLKKQVVVDTESLVGSWVVDNTGSFLENCRSNSLTFTKDGWAISVSGSLETKSRYKPIPYLNGILIVGNKIISDNGGVNCTGQSAEFVKSHLSTKPIYVEFIENGEKLKLYPFGTEDKFYFVFRKELGVTQNHKPSKPAVEQKIAVYQHNLGRNLPKHVLRRTSRVAE